VEMRALLMHSSANLSAPLPEFQTSEPLTCFYPEKSFCQSFMLHFRATYKQRSHTRPKFESQPQVLRVPLNPSQILRQFLSYLTSRLQPSLSTSTCLPSRPASSQASPSPTHHSSPKLSPTLEHTQLILLSTTCSAPCSSGSSWHPRFRLLLIAIWKSMPSAL
jgi:hypothetical protein